MILDKFPSANEFYDTYWGKRPFIVRGGVPACLFDTLIDKDELAGLAMEEDIRARIVTAPDENGKWGCEDGPFTQERLENIGDQDWNLLVQNVEQYHAGTNALLDYFNFAPLWMMDDIMVGFSAAGGTVGPHIDSYHVFLTQGAGSREWKISHSPIKDEIFLEGMDIKILKDGFEGDTYEVNIGDVIYLPPYFGHEGITKSAALSFSIGILGPELSELLSEYSYHLAEKPEMNKRYTGQGFNKNSAGMDIDPNAIKSLQNDLIDVLNSKDFERWMKQYFITPPGEY